MFQEKFITSTVAQVFWSAGPSALSRLPNLGVCSDLLIAPGARTSGATVGGGLEPMQNEGDMFTRTNTISVEWFVPDEYRALASF